ncbi:3-demethylubiquinone-9 3-methyltransferase [alpha proteobacterium AAP81b]|nr:3-demethylubiquinone-9 3-methyltransferase [alpha proteobacterium AAP81b]
MSAAASIAPAEAAFFGRLAADWWNPKGSSAMLHRVTPLRSTLLRDAACERFGRDVRARRPLAGLTALDIGCGAGLMTEPLARMGAEVTGIDAAPENIAAAEAHAAAGGLAIGYRALSVEELAAEGVSADIVTCFEVVEHVADRDSFFAALARLVRPGGLVVMSTPNRTPLSWAVLIAGAEYLARAIPRGAHDWQKFMTPAELTAALAAVGIEVTATRGLGWRPDRSFHLGDDMAVNYFLTAVPNAS